MLLLYNSILTEIDIVMESNELNFFKGLFVVSALWNLIGAIIGYSIVAYNPLKHTGIVIVGGIGKVGFAISLLKFYLSGLAGPVVFIVIIGDFIFSLLFMYYFFRLYQTKESIL